MVLDTLPRLLKIQPYELHSNLADVGNTVAASIPIVLKDAVEYGHKFAVRNIREGQPVTKYAETIGLASRDISAGEHVHVHNVKSLRARKR